MPAAQRPHSYGIKRADVPRNPFSYYETSEAVRKALVEYAKREGTAHKRDGIDGFLVSASLQGVLDEMFGRDMDPKARRNLYQSVKVKLTTSGSLVILAGGHGNVLSELWVCAFNGTRVNPDLVRRTRNGVANPETDTDSGRKSPEPHSGTPGEIENVLVPDALDLLRDADPVLYVVRLADRAFENNLRDPQQIWEALTFLVVRYWGRGELRGDDGRQIRLSSHGPTLEA